VSDLLRQSRSHVYVVLQFRQLLGGGLLLWLPQIVQAMGFSNREVGFIVALPAGATAAAMVWWGRSSDVSGERVWHLTFAMLFGAAGFAMTAVSHSNLIQLLAISAAFVGVLSSTPIIQNLPGTFLRGDAVAAGIGIFNTIGQFGGFVAPLAHWVVIAVTGLPTAVIADNPCPE
jgi:ACS family tartrate transporter-like MFS transporter